MQHFLWDAILDSVAFHKTSVFAATAIRATHLLDLPPLRMSFEVYTSAKITRSSESGRHAGSQELIQNTTKLTQNTTTLTQNTTNLTQNTTKLTQNTTVNLVLHPCHRLALQPVTIAIHIRVQQVSGSNLSVDIVTNYSIVMCRKLQDCASKYVDSICTTTTNISSFKTPHFTTFCFLFGTTTFVR